MHSKRAFFVQTILDCVHKSSLKCWYEWQWRPNRATVRPVRVAASVEWVVDHLLGYSMDPFSDLGDLTTSDFFTWIDGHLHGVLIQPHFLLLSPFICVFIIILFYLIHLRDICCLLTSSRPVFINFSVEHVECHEQGKKLNEIDELSGLIRYLRANLDTC